jgi:hypothetical protein
MILTVSEARNQQQQTAVFLRNISDNIGKKLFINTAVIT